MPRGVLQKPRHASFQKAASRGIPLAAALQIFSLLHSSLRATAWPQQHSVFNAQPADLPRGDGGEGDEDVLTFPAYGE